MQKMHKYPVWRQGGFLTLLICRGKVNQNRAFARNLLTCFAVFFKRDINNKKK